MKIIDYLKRKFYGTSDYNFTLLDHTNTGLRQLTIEPDDCEDEDITYEIKFTASRINKAYVISVLKDEFMLDDWDISNINYDVKNDRFKAMAVRIDKSKHGN